MALDPSSILLTDQVVVVTGAARGIGRATAAACARFGARVAVCDRDHEGLDDTEPASGQTRVRFIHVSPDTDDLDIGTLDTQGTFTPLFTGVGYGSTGHAKTGNYVTGAPLDKATIATRLAGQQANLFTIAGVIVEADRVVTIFAIGNRAGQPELLRLLVCQDEAPHAQGTLGMASCKLLTP